VAGITLIVAGDQGCLGMEIGGQGSWRHQRDQGSTGLSANMEDFLSF
jgi:hypothetical protein